VVSSKKNFKTAMGSHLTAEETNAIALAILSHANQIQHDFRIYYYDCPPSNESVKTPISRKTLSFADSHGYGHMSKFLQELKRKDFFAVREGVLLFRGWTLKPSVYRQKNWPCELTDECFKPHLQQKGVDTKIGLDIAWASYNHITKNIILVTGDSDFAPAMKTARRNGLFVYLYTLNHGVAPPILDNADILNRDDIRSFL